MSDTPLRFRLAVAAYQVALAALMPLVWRYFRRRGRGDAAYLEHWGERKGEGAPFDADIWVHAVSLGEFRSAEPLIAKLLAAGKRLVLTHATPAGRRASEAALAAEIGAGTVRVEYAPLDRTSYWRAFFARIRPRTGLVMEMEFWPGMIEAARQEGVALWLTNAQVPGKSLPRALRVRSWLGAHPAGRTAGVFAKSERMADRFRRLGAKTVRAVGETRFDIPAPKPQTDAGAALAKSLGGRQVVAFASVVQGEEQVYLDAVQALQRDAQPPLVIWVPRAPEAFDPTFDLLKQVGLRVARRSQTFDADMNPIQSLDCDVLLGDSFGEMFFYLAAADVVSVGGGFVEKGAHNIIEPLALSRPVVTGPHIWTIEFPGEEAREAGVLSVCEETGELAALLRSHMSGDGRAEAAFHAQHLGASQRIADAILMGETL